MDLISGWTNYNRGCGCPANKALFVNTYAGDASGQVISIHDPATGAFIGYWFDALIVGAPRNIGITELNCTQYVTSFLNQRIGKFDALTDELVTSIPVSPYSFPEPTGIDNDGTNLWVLHDTGGGLIDPTTPATALYVNPADGSIITSILFHHVTRDPFPNDQRIFGLCFNGTDLVVQQQAGNLVTSNIAAGIWDKYDTSGNLLVGSFIDISSLLTIGAFSEFASPSIVWTGSEYLIADTISNRIAHVDASGGFTGFTHLVSSVGVGSDYDAGGTFCVLGYITNPFALS